jgi:hypothetical protein
MRAIPKHTNEYAEKKSAQSQRGWRSVCRAWLGVVHSMGVNLPLRSPERWPGGLQETSITTANASCPKTRARSGISVSENSAEFTATETSHDGWKQTLITVGECVRNAGFEDKGSGAFGRR